jgi:hypothetical protein
VPWEYHRRVASGTSLAVEPSATRADRFERWLAVGLWALCVAAAALGLLYGIADLATGRSVIVESLASYAAPVVVSWAYGSVGLLLRIRRPDINIGWLFLGIGVVVALSSLAWAYSTLALALGSSVGAIPPAEVAWAANATMAPFWLSLAVALAYLFPDGRAPSHRARVALICLIPLSIAAAIGLAFAPGTLVFFPLYENPHGASGALGVAAMALATVPFLVITATAIGAPFVMRSRYLQATELERLQLKWFAWAATLLLVFGLVEIVMASSLSGASSATADLAWVVFTGAATLVPIAAVFAILRYRLYDIDRVISRTFVYGALTAILAGLYAASIKLFTSFFVDVTRQSSDTALVLTTLVLATTFTPIKGWLEGVAASWFRPSQAAAGGTVPAGLAVGVGPAGGAAGVAALDLPESRSLVPTTLWTRASRQSPRPSLAGSSTSSAHRT